MSCPTAPPTITNKHNIQTYRKIDLKYNPGIHYALAPTFLPCTKTSPRLYKSLMALGHRSKASHGAKQRVLFFPDDLK